MADIKGFKARKPQTLTENESLASFNSWRQNIEFHIASCDQFAPFLDVTWGTKGTANRGLVDDTTAGGKTAAQKAIMLNHLIGYIVSYSPANIRQEIERKCTSLAWIWPRIRRHHGFTKSEVNFLKLSSFKRVVRERYESF